MGRVLYPRPFCLILDTYFHILDKYIVPLGGKVLNFRYKATGITKENLEEYGEPFEAVRDEFAKGFG